MFCKECGEQCGDTDKFCWKCGAKMPEKPPVDEAVVKKPDVKTVVKENATNIRNYSSTCVSINNENCKVCTYKKSIDDAGYYWCEKYKQSFKIISIKKEVEYPKCVRINNENCKVCSQIEAIDDAGYYWCNKYKESFKNLWIKIETKQPKKESGYNDTKVISKKDGIYWIDGTKCTNCGACENVCPSDAISEKHYIDQAKCVCCGFCTTICQAKAIVRL